MNLAIVPYDKLKREIALIQDIDKALDYRDKAQAITQYIKNRGEGLKAVNGYSELKIISERVLGRLIPDKVSPGNPQLSHDERISLDELGIDHNQSHRWQKEAKISEETFERYIALCRAEDLEITTQGFLKFADTSYKIVEGKEEYWTPELYINAVYNVLETIDLDPASCKEANKVIKAKNIYTKEDNGLEQKWYGKVFMNPPYGKEGPKFIKKFIESFDNKDIEEGVILINSGGTDSSWFQLLFNEILCFTNHRIKFNSPEGKTDSPISGSCFIYFGEDKERFAKEFKQFGNVVMKYGI